MSRQFTLVEQVGGLSWQQLRERSRALLGPKAVKLAAPAQRSALADHYENNPRLYRRYEAPRMREAEYDEILDLLTSLPWNRIARRNVPKSRNGAKAAESFVMGGVLGQRGFYGFRGATVGKMGYNDNIVPLVLAKQSDEVLKLWCLLKDLLGRIDPAFEYTSVQVNRNFRGLPHRDKHDVTYQYALSLGDFSGGRLLAETGDPNVVAAFDTHGRPTRLDGRRVHWVAPHTGGDRYSLIMYAVKGEPTPVSDETNASFVEPEDATVRQALGFASGPEYVALDVSE